MGAELTRKNLVSRRKLAGRNWIAFPRELRDAIPDLFDGRVLELDAVTGRASKTPPLGPAVELKLVAKETGKLTGSFVVGVRLQPEAARRLSTTLAELADQARS